MTYRLWQLSGVSAQETILCVCVCVCRTDKCDVCICTVWLTQSFMPGVIDCSLCMQGMIDCSLCMQGMIDPGELVSETLKREFGEETMNSLEADSDKKAKLKTQVAEFFKNGSEVYFVTFSPFTRKCYAFLVSIHVHLECFNWRTWVPSPLF